MTKALNIVLAAEEAAGIQTLRRLVRSGHRIVTVLSGERGRSAGAATVAAAARAHGLRVRAPELVSSSAFADELRRAHVDLLINVHSLHVVSPDVLAAPSVGSFNLHPGPLPELRGFNVPSWAIFHDHRRHGVSLHWMTQKIDGGPLAYEARFDIDPAETGLSLSLKCIRHGLPLVDSLVADAAAGAAHIPMHPQRGEPRYFGRETPFGGCLPWSLPAHRLAAFVRACDYRPFRSHWGHPTTSIGGVHVGVASAVPTGEPTAEPPGVVATGADGGALVATGDSWLRIERVEVDGRYADARDFFHVGERCQPYEAVSPDSWSASPGHHDVTVS